MSDEPKTYKVGPRIMRRFRGKNLVVKEFAKRVGVVPQTLYDWERHKSADQDLRLGNIINAAAALGDPLAEIVTGEVPTPALDANRLLNAIEATERAYPNEDPRVRARMVMRLYLDPSTHPSLIQAYASIDAEEFADEKPVTRTFSGPDDDHPG